MIIQHKRKETSPNTSLKDPPKRDAEVQTDSLNKTSDAAYMALPTKLPAGMFERMKGDFWIVDTGASSHMTNKLDGMFDLKDPQGDKVTVGNGETCPVVKKGKLNVCFVHKDGSKCRQTLTNVKFVPGLKHNLFGMLTAFLSGCCGSGILGDNKR